MKRAVILHGTNGSPEDCWLPWLKKSLEAKGYEVLCPLLPDNHTPNRHTYEVFLKNIGWDFTDNIIIGHSSGSTTALNLLMSDWFPKVKATVLVGTFLNERLLKGVDWVVPDQFKDLFLDSYDPETLVRKSEKFYFVHGDNDPYCDINDAKELCTKVGGTFIEVQNGHHLSNSSGFYELPLLLDQLVADKII